MLLRLVQRSDFGDVTRGRGRRAASSITARDLSSVREQNCLAVWSSEKTEAVSYQLPELLIVPDGEERDWLAWLSTFLPTVRPFTSFCRVVASGDFVARRDALRTPAFGQVGGGCIGLILGEILTSLPEEAFSRLREPLAVSACATTLSFALTRQLGLYERPVGDGALPGKWARLRALTRQKERDIPIEAVTSVIDALSAIGRDDRASAVPEVVRACEELLSRGELRPGAYKWDSVSPLLAHIPEQGATREARVEAFDRSVQEAMASRVPNADFALGYLASRLATGSLIHAALLASLRDRFPAVMLWYGTCAGLTGDDAIPSAFGGVGRRVFRELCVPDSLYTRPRSDISALELDVLFTGSGEDIPLFPTNTPSLLAVELEPGITSVVNWPPRVRRPETEAGRAEELERAQRNALVHQLDEIGTAIARLVDVYSRIQGEATDRQASLFAGNLEERTTGRGGRRRR